MANRLSMSPQGVFVPPHCRRIGLVFQDSNLFPHLSVKQNLLFGRWFAPIHARVEFDAVVDTLGIGSLLSRRPARLSGGERQRVAIGRALLSRPKLLLFDEPLAALDMARKLEIMPLIERIRDEFQRPHRLCLACDRGGHAARRRCRGLLEERQGQSDRRPDEVFGPVGAGSLEDRFDRLSVLTVRRLAAKTQAYGSDPAETSGGNDLACRTSRSGWAVGPHHCSTPPTSFWRRTPPQWR